MAQSLGLSPNALTDFVGPGAELGAEKTATMVRLFRYEGCNNPVGEGRVVAERTFADVCRASSILLLVSTLKIHLLSPKSTPFNHSN